MFEQLLNELGELWIACTTYPFSVTLAISITLNFMVGYQFLKLKESYKRVSILYDKNQEAYFKLSRECGKLEDKLKKYQKIKKPVTNTKHRIRSKLNKLK